MRSDGELFLGVAADIAHRIAGSAVWSDGRCNWMGRPRERAVPRVGPGGGDGARRRPLRGHERRRAVPRRGGGPPGRAAPRVRRRSERCGCRSSRPDGSETDGLYAGRLGVAYAAVRVAALHGAEDVAAGAAELVKAWRPTGPEATTSWAGVRQRLGLVALAAPGPPGHRARRRALARAERGPEGWSWRDPRRPRCTTCADTRTARPAWATPLAELFGATGEDRYRDAAEQAFAYERSWLDPRTGTWPDLRGVARAPGGVRRRAGG